jgi:D-arabinose 1-dehydrogenase-like Zn-dependent alcohol dehydrogenase
VVRGWCVPLPSQLTAGKDNFCPDFLYTFGAGQYKRGLNKGKQNYGGFATHWRGPARFAIPVPAGLDPAQASSLMCAGMTVFAPLKRFGVPHKAPKVGVLGIGGLGHMAIKIAKAMGAEVTAISRGEAKKAQALELGADKYIATGSNLKEDLAPHFRCVDVIISTISEFALGSADQTPPRSTLRRTGPSSSPRARSASSASCPSPWRSRRSSSSAVRPRQRSRLTPGCMAVSGSNIASPAVIKELLELAADKKIEPWIQKWKWEDMNEAIVNTEQGKAKFRNVLVLEQNGGKL